MHYNKSLFLIYFKYSNLYLLISYSNLEQTKRGQIILLATISLSSVFEFVSALYTNSFVLFLDSTYNGYYIVVDFL